MRDNKKLLNLMISEPDASNEFLLNTAGSSPNMSVEEIGLENRCVNALKKEDKEFLKKLISYV